MYTPKHSLNKSKHYNVNSLLAKNSAPERSSVYSSGGHQAQKQSGSQFVYYGRQSTTQPTITIKEPKNEDLSSKPPKITSHAPESKSPTGYPSTTCTVAKNNLVSDSQASCSLSGCSDSRKRKRTMSARASRQLTKRPRRCALYVYKYWHVDIHALLLFLLLASTRVCSRAVDMCGWQRVFHTSTNQGEWHRLISYMSSRGTYNSTILLRLY